MSSGRATLLLAIPALLACAAAEATPDAPGAGTRYPELAVGIAPFAVGGEPGSVAPDIASLVGERLSGRGVGRVVPGSAEGGELSAEAAQAWAVDAELDAIVVGRVTRIGESLSLDARVRRPSDGSVAGTFVEEAKSAAGLPAAVDALSDRLLGAAILLAAKPAPTPEPAQPAPAPSAPAKAADDSVFGFRAAGGSLSINSEELDADDSGGSRRIVFRRNVVARQADLELRCDRLEALYPGGTKQPTRLIARGNVRLSQGAQRAWCDEAELDRSRDKLFCRGNARFREGENELNGREIEIDLAKETVQVRGGARFVVHEDEPASPAGVSQ